MKGNGTFISAQKELVGKIKDRKVKDHDLLALLEHHMVAENHQKFGEVLRTLKIHRKRIHKSLLAKKK